MRNSMQAKRRRGATAVFVVVTIPVMLGMAALTLDVGALYNTRADLQNAADSAALAAIDVLAHSANYADPVAEAMSTAADYVRRNAVLGETLTVDPATDIVLGKAVFDAASNSYNFTPAALPTNAIQIIVRRTSDSPNGGTPLYFASIFGASVTDVSAGAIAMFIENRYEERDCSFVPPAGQALVCAPGIECGGKGGDSDDSDDSAAGTSDDSDDSYPGGADDSDSDDSDSDDSDLSDSEDCFGSDSESGPAGGPHTISVNDSAVAGWLLKGATLGPCACIVGDPDDSDDSEAGDSVDSDDSSAAGGSAISDKTLVCHVSSKNPNSKTVIAVSPAALAGHLGHGDTVGNCPGKGSIQILLIQ